MRNDRVLPAVCDRPRDRYVWLRRYRQAGVTALIEQSRAAHQHGNQSAEDFEQTVLQLRQAHTPWP